MLLSLFLVREATRVAELWNGLTSVFSLPWQRLLPEARPLGGREGSDGAGCQDRAVLEMAAVMSCHLWKGPDQRCFCLLVLSLESLVLTFPSPRAHCSHLGLFLSNSSPCRKHSLSSLSRSTLQSKIARQHLTKIVYDCWETRPTGFLS